METLDLESRQQAQPTPVQNLAPFSDSPGSRTPRPFSGDFNLDSLMTVQEFARWLGVTERWLRKRLRILPGVIMESRETVRIHPKTYLEARLSNRARSRGELRRT
jgi:hypothetical protein